MTDAPGLLVERDSAGISGVTESRTLEARQTANLAPQELQASGLASIADRLTEIRDLQRESITLIKRQRDPVGDLGAQVVEISKRLATLTAAEAHVVQERQRAEGLERALQTTRAALEAAKAEAQALRAAQRAATPINPTMHSQYVTPRPARKRLARRRVTAFWED